MTERLTDDDLRKWREYLKNTPACADAMDELIALRARVKTLEAALKELQARAALKGAPR